MLVYRITLAKYSGKLIASGRAARWNPNDVEMIYTAASRSLACLENVVHRDKLGLSLVFNILTIECPDAIKIETIPLKGLPANWIDFDQMYLTQKIGEEWVKNNGSAILQVPSSIVSEEVNYLINPKHPDFGQIKIVKTQPFVFDSRIKL
ncbi:RES family NAD+ phosphorylase [Mucilaginibacter sp. OK098]|uniref:RES family NAD+ phosphorylase n=1 Tax=Mucilaginibacter sp. OK098 TaxID=1855297 RepID=UPI000916D27A|nr:RES family NAD+ phosphorylase [Mucilaginibacter sp. OK098]SHN34324.1 RES domain-containing protein [Mucilaginibacter sp. OK098]